MIVDLQIIINFAEVLDNFKSIGVIKSFITMHSSCVSLGSPIYTLL